MYKCNNDRKNQYRNYLKHSNYELTDNCKVMRDDMEQISDRLKALLCLISTVCSGLQNEKTEKQVISCLECIAQCVRDTKSITDNFCNKVYKD